MPNKDSLLATVAYVHPPRENTGTLRPDGPSRRKIMSFLSNSCFTTVATILQVRVETGGYYCWATPKEVALYIYAAFQLDYIRTGCPTGNLRDDETVRCTSITCQLRHLEYTKSSYKLPVLSSTLIHSIPTCCSKRTYHLFIFNWFRVKSTCKSENCSRP